MISQFNRIAIGRGLLTIIISLLLFSYTSANHLPDYPKNKDAQITKLQENIDVAQSNVLRSSSEGLTFETKLSHEALFNASEEFYSTTLHVQFTRQKEELKHFQSSVRIYIQCQKLLI